MSTRAERERMADRGCAKEALELLDEIPARRYPQHTNAGLRLRMARSSVLALVEALVAEEDS